MNFTTENVALLVIGLAATGFTPLIARLNARAFPYPSPRVTYIVTAVSQIATGLLLIALGLRGLILGCPPFPIEQMPAHCR